MYSDLGLLQKVPEQCVLKTAQKLGRAPSHRDPVHRHGGAAERSGRGYDDFPCTHQLLHGVRFFIDRYAEFPAGPEKMPSCNARKDQMIRRSGFYASVLLNDGDVGVCTFGHTTRTVEDRLIRPPALCFLRGEHGGQQIQRFHVAEIKPFVLHGDKPVVAPKARLQNATAKQKAIRSVICGSMVGFICGFIGAGGGMMMLLVLTTVLGYELKTAVGTSVFIMAATALTGSVSHFAIGGAPDPVALITCVSSTLVFALIAALIANKVSAKTLNRATGVVLVVLGAAIIIVNRIK